MEPVTKQRIAVLTARAKRPGITGISGSSRQEKSFPQGLGESALLIQQNSSM